MRFMGSPPFGRFLWGDAKPRNRDWPARRKITRARWNKSRAADQNRIFAPVALAPKSPSQAVCTALSCGQPIGGNHEEHCWQVGRGAAGAGADVGFCRSAKQDHRRDRGRLLPVLSADGAGQAARRIRKGRAWPSNWSISRAARTRSRPCSAAAPTWFPAISTIASIWPPRSRSCRLSWSMTAIPGWCWWCRPRTPTKSNRSRIWPARRSASARRVPRPISS